MRFRSAFIFLLAGFMISCTLGRAQKTYSSNTLEKEYDEAFELFEREKYGAAQNAFLHIASQLKDIDSELRTSSEYYAALCGVYLFHDDAEFMLNRFIARHPESMKSRKAFWEMALFLYSTKKYRKAADYFSGVDLKILSEEQQSEYYFKKGYSHFMVNDFDAAKLAFYEIKDIQSDYTSPAIYYYAYIAYSRENFETALNGFRRLEQDENFAAIVPYYILQILYKQEKYDEIIQYGPDLLEDAIPGRAAEIAKFVGDAYYQQKKYEEARFYLDLYVDESPSISREDRYQMGFMYHQLEAYEQAVPYFERVGGRQDLLGQNAHYLLADCYLKLDDKEKAGIAFFTAASMNFDEEIQEDALFNYAKITYELDFSPFNEVIRAFQQFIESYPHSERIDEAYQFLVMAYLNTRNYKMAYESLRKVQNKSPRIREAYQRVAFFRGLELYSNLNFDEAIDLFQTSLDQGNFDPVITARATYWMAESYYRLNQFGEAVDLYRAFLVTPGAFSTEEFVVAHYNTGYCYFNLEEYQEAARWFRKYLDLDEVRQVALVADTYNRLGDCAFMAMDYPGSVAYYDRSINLEASSPDYALFQRSFAQGLLKQHAAKINGLTELRQKFPESPYVDDALFERGKSHVKINQLDQALVDFRAVIEQYPNSSYHPKALLEIGLVYYNQNRNQDAIATYKEVIEKFQGTPEARSALTGLRTVYVEINEVDAYFSYARSLGSFANVSMSEQDSLTYQSGENLYMSGDCDRAIRVFTDYIDAFPSGSFIVNARFYRAECLANQERFQEALADYQAVIEQPRNVFTEPALLAASAMDYDAGQWAEALDHYTYLENVAENPENKRIARLGQIRCLYHLENFRGVVSAAPRILSSEQIPEEVRREVYFKLGKSHYNLDQLDEALDAFLQVATEIKSREGAEAKYRVAQIHYQQGQYDRAAEVVSEFINTNTPHQTWMARVFILSADISIHRNDLFQARYTLQSLIDYYEVDDDGIKAEARTRLQTILELEEFENQEKEAVPDTIRKEGISQ
jgi:TolA-binding protein